MITWPMASGVPLIVLTVMTPVVATESEVIAPVTLLPVAAAVSAPVTAFA